MAKHPSHLALAIRMALALSGGLVGLSAFAQTTPADSSDQSRPDAQNAKRLEAVTVTGSRIRSVDIETQQPVFTLSRDDIAKTGLVTSGDILNHLVSASSTTYGKASVLASNFEQGGNT